ncbi:MAG: hypothetical protein IPL21_17020 [Saprospirales bacterium]|nr:hypothetical protein [Saprospirales bacterium]
MKTILYFLLILSVHAMFGQDTIYYDINNKKVKKTDNWNDYDVGVKTDAGFLVTGYYKNGNIKAIANSKDRDCSKLDGHVIWYLEDGSVNTDNLYKDGVYVHPVVTKKVPNPNKCEDCYLPNTEDSLVEFSGVVTHQGTAERLLQKAVYALALINTEFTPYSTVTTNKEQMSASRLYGFEISYGSLDPLYDLSDANPELKYRPRGMIYYTLTIFCKDNRYKYKFHDFYFVPDEKRSVTYKLNQMLEYVVNSTNAGQSLIGKTHNKEQVITRINCAMNGSVEVNNKKMKGKEYMGFIEFVNLKMNSKYSTLKSLAEGADLKEKKSEW